MKCTKCDGRGVFLMYRNSQRYDLEYTNCVECNGTGEINDDSLCNIWDSSHPGWKNFKGHLNSKWKTRFVVSGSELYDEILKKLNQNTGLEYFYITFSETKVFPGENEKYQYPCAYFFPKSERDVAANITKEELNELYWY